MCLVSLYYPHYLMYHCVSKLYNNNYSLVILLSQLFAILFTTFLQAPKLVRQICIPKIFKTRLFSTHATRLHTRLNELLLTPCLLCLALLQSNTNSLANVLDVEGSRSRLLANSIAIKLLFVHFVHIVVCAFAYLSIRYSLILVVVVVYLERV